MIINKQSIGSSLKILLIFTLLNKFIGLARGIIFARILGPKELGIFNLINPFLSIILSFSTFGLLSTFMRYIPKYENLGMLKDYIKRISKLIILFVIGCSFMLLFFTENASIFIYGKAEYRNLVLIGILTMIPMVLYELIFRIFYGLRSFRIREMLRFCQLGFFTLLGIISISLLPTAKAALIANLLSYIIVSVIFGSIILSYIKNINKQDKTINEKNFFVNKFKFGIWFLVIPVIMQLFGATDRWMLNRYTNLENVGIYSVMMAAANFLFMIGVALGDSLVPNLSEMWEHNNKSRVNFLLNFLTKILVFFLITLSLLILIFKKEFISIMYGEEYFSGVAIIQYLLIFYIFYSIYWSIGVFPTLIEKTYYPFFSSSIGLICNIIFNYFLIRKFGITGAAIATTSAYAIILFILIIINKKLGMQFRSETLIIYLLPLILLIKTSYAFIIWMILIFLATKTDIFFNGEEKRIIYSKFQNLFLKTKKLVKLA
ncbi:MAG: oligosaccharide flippase family protein [Candidatus Hodarchaeota archaeon]